jgi:hypothetical protein
MNQEIRLNAMPDAGITIAITICAGLVRVAPLKLALVRSAFVKLVLEPVAPLEVAPDRFAPVKLVPVTLEPLKSYGLHADGEQDMPLKFALVRLEL